MTTQDRPRVAIPAAAAAGFEDLWASGEHPPEMIIGPVESARDLAVLTEGCDVLVIAGEVLTPPYVRGIAPSVRLIARLGVGVDNIDFAAVRERRLPVLIQPTYASREVASHAVALLLAVNRRIVAFDRFARDGWTGRYPLPPLPALAEMVVGLVGAGAIGRWVSAFLSPMVAEVIVHDPGLAEPPPGTARLVGLDEIYRLSDAVSLHLPLTDQTRHFLGRAEFARMRREAVLINVSRGALVDEAALADALASGTIAGAGLDAFEHEPLPRDSPLRSAPNVILSPHAAWYSGRSREQLILGTMADIDSFLASGSVRSGRLIG